MPSQTKRRKVEMDCAADEDEVCAKDVGEPLVAYGEGGKRFEEGVTGVSEP